MLKAVLFDVDDTLIDWGDFNGDWAAIETPHLLRVYDYLNREVHPIPSADDFVEQYMRRVESQWVAARNSLRAPHVGRVLVDSAIALGVPDHAINMQDCLDAYRWTAVQQTALFSDVVEVLTKLRARGIKMGTVTNSFYPAALRDREFEAFGILEYFPDCRVSAADVGYLKPHPNIFRAALDCLGLQAENVVFVGDNPTADITGPQRVGMRAIIRRPRRPRQTTGRLVLPDGEIDSLKELPDLLDSLYAEV